MRSEGYNSCLVCVCLSGHAILVVRAIKSIMKDTIVLSVRFAAILKWRFFLNCLIRKLERFSLNSAGAAIFFFTVIIPRRACAARV